VPRHRAQSALTATRRPTGPTSSPTCDGFDTPVAQADNRDRSFCLYLNENYGAAEAADTAAAMLKVHCALPTQAAQQLQSIPIVAR